MPCRAQLQRHLDQAIEYYNQALTITRAIGDRISEAMILEGLAFAYFESDQGEKSVELTETAVQIYEVSGSPYAVKARKKLAYFREQTSKKWWQFWL